MNEGDKPFGESRYRRAEMPKIQSHVPPELADGVTKKDLYLMQSLSVIEQQANWLMSESCRSSEIYVELDLRLEAMERWKASITSRGTLIWAILCIVAGTLFTTIIGPLLVEWVKHKVLGP